MSLTSGVGISGKVKTASAIATRSLYHLCGVGVRPGGQGIHLQRVNVRCPEGIAGHACVFSVHGATLERPLVRGAVSGPAVRDSGLGWKVAWRAGLAFPWLRG
jgi:hypothetical protein